MDTAITTAKNRIPAQLHSHAITKKCSPRRQTSPPVPPPDELDKTYVHL